MTFDEIAGTNASAGQLRPGETFRSHSRHPSEWMMVCRAPGAVVVRCLADGRRVEVSPFLRVFSERRS